MQVLHLVQQIKHLISKLGSTSDECGDKKRFIQSELKYLITDLIEKIEVQERDRTSLFLINQQKGLQSQSSFSFYKENKFQQEIRDRDRQLEIIRSELTSVKQYNAQLYRENSRQENVLTKKYEQQIKDLNSQIRQLYRELKRTKPEMPDCHAEYLLLEKRNKLNEYMADAYGEFPQWDEEPPRETPTIDRRQKRSQLFDW
jgi:lantibiotic modifying enzyme